MPTLSLKWNSLTFHWLFPDQNSFFPDHFTACSPRILPLQQSATPVFYQYWHQSKLILKMYELYIRNMCLNKKRQTTGSKRVRKEHYIHFWCIRLFVNMLYCLPELFASWFQRIFPVFFFKYVRVYGSKWPQDMANLDLRGMVGKIYAGDH